MKNRTLIKDLNGSIGSNVYVAGFVDKVRDLKKRQFLVVADYTGRVQVVHEKTGLPLDETVSALPEQSAVVVGGKVVSDKKIRLGGLEIQLDGLDVKGAAKPGIPITFESGIDLRLDWRYLDLRDPKKRLIFQVQTTAEQAMREYWTNNGFIEIHSPKLVSGASESGAELFKLDYFGQTASLAQSPQFYKQMAMAAGFDKAFEIGPVFRANKSHTSRHDTEFTSVDSEISWIDSHEEVMEMEERWLNYVMGKVSGRHGKEIKDAYGVDVVVPQVPFPRVTMNEAYKILETEGHVVQRSEKGDLDPEGEKKLGQYIQEKFDHEFVFVTEYPAQARPFYHMRFADRPETTKSFDLLWNGLEVTTGAQREHRYDKLVDQALEKGVDTNAIASYIDFFKYGCPPHGGYGFGLTRMLMNLTGLENVREVTFVYRGPTRLTP